MARVQRYTSHRGGAYIWLNPEMKRHLGVRKGDYIVVEKLTGRAIRIARLTKEVLDHAGAQEAPALPDPGAPRAAPR